MNSKIVVTLLSLMIFAEVIIAQQRECAPVMNTSLFNGKDLTSWEFFLKDPSVDPATVFTVKSAAIHVTGDPFGYMKTRLQFTNYKLHLEWRWPEEATNSGVFLHMQQPDAIWPTCFEVQLMAGNAGDLICMGESDATERTDKSNRVIKKRAPSNEVAVGDWNTLEVTCSGNTIEVFVNGLLQNKATGLNASQGFICLQSEGKDIEFRNVYITALSL